MKHYNKKPLSIEEQFDILESRNITINDYESCRNFLQFNNYYRISPYWKILNTPNHNQKPINFDLIIKRYNLDHSLRLLLIENLKIIEIALKTQFAYQLSLKYKNPHFYFDNNIFQDFGKLKHNDTIQTLKTDISKSKSLFLKHYNIKYVEELPPIWVSIEAITFGTFSRFIKCLKNNDDKKIFSSIFNIHHVILQEWINSFVQLRNICSHHSTIFNQNLSINVKTKPYKRSPHINIKPLLISNKKIYNLLIMILYFFKNSNIKNSFNKDLLILFENNKSDLEFYGFPHSYEDTFKQL